MAINPSTLYPGRVEAPSADYPQGTARNESVEGADDGTPFEASIIKDVWGFLQALLLRSAIAPTGDPDTALASQYMDALTGEGTPVLPLDALGAGEMSITNGTKKIVVKADGYATQVTVGDTSTDVYSTVGTTGIKVESAVGSETEMVPKGINFWSFGTEEMSPVSVRLYDASSMSWAAGTSYITTSSSDLILTGIAYGVSIISISIRFNKVSSGVPVSAPLNCTFKNTTGTLTIDSALALCDTIPSLGTNQQIAVVYEVF